MAETQAMTEVEETMVRETAESLGLRVKKLHRRISWEEFNERWFKGLCMFCDELETPDHHLCHKNSGILMMDCDEDKSPNDKESLEMEVPTELIESVDSTVENKLNHSTYSVLNQQVPSISHLELSHRSPKESQDVDDDLPIKSVDVDDDLPSGIVRTHPSKSGFDLEYDDSIARQVFGTLSLRIKLLQNLRKNKFSKTCWFKFKEFVVRQQDVHNVLLAFLHLSATETRYLTTLRYGRLWTETHMLRLWCEMGLIQILQDLQKFIFGDEQFQIKHKWRTKCDHHRRFDCLRNRLKSKPYYSQESNTSRVVSLIEFVLVFEKLQSDSVTEVSHSVFDVVVAIVEEDKLVSAVTFNWLPAQLQFHCDDALSQRGNNSFINFGVQTKLTMQGNTFERVRFLRPTQMSRMRCRLWLRQALLELEQFTVSEVTFQIKNMWRFKLSQGGFSHYPQLVVAANLTTQMHFGVASNHVWHRWKARYFASVEDTKEAIVKFLQFMRVWIELSFERDSETQTTKLLKSSSACCSRKFFLYKIGSKTHLTQYMVWLLTNVAYANHLSVGVGLEKKQTSSSLRVNRIWDPGGF